MFLLDFSKMIMIGIILFVILFSTCMCAYWNLSKQDIIKAYDSFIQNLGSHMLTKDKRLVGKRNFGIDRYVGTYQAYYEYFTGKEILFGGTNLYRKNGEYLHLKIKVEKQNGQIKVIQKLGTNEDVILAGSGNYEKELYIEGMSYYLIVKLENFAGKLEIEVE